MWVEQLLFSIFFRWKHLNTRAKQSTCVTASTHTSCPKQGICRNSIRHYWKAKTNHSKFPVGWISRWGGKISPAWILLNQGQGVQLFVSFPLLLGTIRGTFLFKFLVKCLQLSVCNEILPIGNVKKEFLHQPKKKQTNRVKTPLSQGSFERSLPLNRLQP